MEILRHATIRRQATTTFIPATTSKTKEETDVPVKDVKYIYWVKKDFLGCFRIEEIRDNDNETGLKERGGIELSTIVLPLRDAHSLRF